MLPNRPKRSFCLRLMPVIDTLDADRIVVRLHYPTGLYANLTRAAKESKPLRALRTGARARVLLERKLGKRGKP